MPSKQRLQELSLQAKFVFQGTVKKRGDTTMPGEVPVSDKTLIVTVDEIVQAPEMMSSLKGKDITVQLGSGQRAEEGQSYVFYTNGWIYSSSIAVVAVAVTPARAATVRQVGLAAEAAPTMALQSRLEEADAVVSGRVVEVRDAPRPPGTPISEHDPAWRDALVQVENVAKGTQADHQVIVRFAASRDVRWKDAPKFSTGDSGVWLLHSEAVPATSFAAAAPGAEVYTVTDPADFLPQERFPQVRSLVR